jgi:NitT/TauT family transport system permease protein
VPPAQRNAITGDTGTPVIVWQIVVGIVLLGGWEAVGHGNAAEWTSRPTLIISQLLEWLRGPLYPHLAATAIEVGTGLLAGVACGTVAGLLLGRSPVLSVVLRPIIVAFYSIPLVALAPLFIMFFGLDILPKIILVSIVVFFLLFFNTFTGAAEVDNDLIAAVGLMGSTGRENFQKVVAPACMAWIIGGIKIALPYALVAATTGEMLAARRGLGFLLSDSATNFNMTGLYAALVILMLLGLAVSEAAVRMERYLLRWRDAAV